MTQKRYLETFRRPTSMNLLGLSVHPAGSQDVEAAIEEVIKKGEKAVFLNLNLYAISLAMRLPWFHQFIRKAHLVFCDGDGVRWGLRLLGHKPPSKTPTTRWIWSLAHFASEKQYRIYFLGGKPGIADAAVEKLKETYPNLKIAGTHHGYFDKEGKENDEVIAKINRIRPDILMVCFGMPFQEKWIHDNWQQLQVHVFLKGGAVFDYVSGRLGKVPQWMVRLNLEWLFRICEEPTRLLGRYLFDIPYVFFFICVERIKKLFRNDEHKS